MKPVGKLQTQEGCFSVMTATSVTTLTAWIHRCRLFRKEAGSANGAFGCGIRNAGLFCSTLALYICNVSLTVIML